MAIIKDRNNFTGIHRNFGLSGRIEDVPVFECKHRAFSGIPRLWPSKDVSGLYNDPGRSLAHFTTGVAVQGRLVDGTGLTTFNDLHTTSGTRWNCLSSEYILVQNVDSGSKSATTSTNDKIYGFIYDGKTTTRKATFMVQRQTNTIIKKEPLDCVYFSTGRNGFNKASGHDGKTGDSTFPVENLVALVTPISFNHLKNIHVVDT